MVEEAISFWTEIQRFENMLEADPRSLSFAPLSELYRKLGLLDDAISVAKKGCELHPEYPGGFFALGAACLDKGLKDQARPALERVIRLNPEHVRALKLLGQLYVEIGENDLARKVLGQVLEQNQDDTECALLLHSLGDEAASALPEAPADQDEEVLEELEVIEDLFEILDEPVEPPAAGAGPEGGADAAASRRDPLSTATLAELYVSQGFLEKAIGIYLELLTAAPGNQSYRLRCTELRGALEREKSAAKGASAPIEFPAAAAVDSDAAADDDYAVTDGFQPVEDAEDAGIEEGYEVAEAFDVTDRSEAAQGSRVVDALNGESVFEVAEDFEAAEDFEVAEEFEIAEELEAEPEPAASEDLPGPAEAELPDSIWAAPLVSPASPAAAALPEPEFAPLEDALDISGFAPIKAAAAHQAGAQAPAGELEGELNRWLENIRRRRDGL